MQMTEKGWGFLCEKSRESRKKILADYAKKYVEPVLEKYPEMKGKVYLVLRKQGFFAEYDPVYHIVAPEKPLTTYGKNLLLAITAHEFGHLIQYERKIGEKEQDLVLELHATLLSWKRGFALNYLLSFQENCEKERCDHSEKHCYFGCDYFFGGNCRQCTDVELKRKAAILENIARDYEDIDKLDVKTVRSEIRRLLREEKIADRKTES